MSSSGNIQATIDGDIKGQVAVGNYILQIGDVNGGVVNVAPQTQAPNYTRRISPVNLRPRPFPSLLDRDDETASAKSALQASTPVSLFGPAGIGKTSLLRNLAHAPELASFPDGVVYLNVSGLGLEDLLQALFDAFHESQSSFKPSDTEIRVALQGVKALIMLDDLTLSRDEITALMDTSPGCAFVLASLERSIWGEGKIISLNGLPVEEGLDLFVLELNRALVDQEQAEVREICASLDGHPLRILQTASLVREKTKTISALRSELQGDAPESALVSNSLNTLTESQQRMLAILAAGDGAAIPEIHLGTLSKSPDVYRELQGLISLGLVQAHSPRYSLTGSLPASLASLWDLSSWEDVLINYLVEWLSQQPGQMLIEESADVLVSSIKKAGEKKRWPEVIRLGRALERILIMWKRWQSWLDILNLVLKAARALGDRKAEAWALHQIGTRAACLGFNEPARGFLTQALQIRQAIGDQAGMALTQNNLHVFFKIPLPPNTGQSGCRRWLKCGAIGAGAIGVVGVVVVGLALLFSGLSRGSTPPVPPTQVLSATRTLTDTPEILISPSHTATLPSPTRTTQTPTLTPTLTPTRTPTSPPNILVDFVFDAGSAVWESSELFTPGDDVFGACKLTFDDPPSEPCGFALWESTTLEDDSIRKNLLIVQPYHSSGGLVRGTYDYSYLVIEEGYQLVTTVGFVKNAETFGVTFRVLFTTGDPDFSPVVVYETPDTNDGKLIEAVTKLPEEIIGEKGFFILEVSALPNTGTNWASWVIARLDHP